MAWIAQNIGEIDIYIYRLEQEIASQSKENKIKLASLMDALDCLRSSLMAKSPSVSRMHAGAFRSAIRRHVQETLGVSIEKPYEKHKSKKQQRLREIDLDQ